MNRGKSYRILITFLFFAFISLISRSLIYLVISLTIAVLIIVLLSRDVKEKESLKQSMRNGVSTSGIAGQANSGSLKNASSTALTFPVLFLITGAIMTTFGFTGYFDIQGVFHYLGWMTDETFVLLVFLIVGLFLLLYGATSLLKKWLS